MLILSVAAAVVASVVLVCVTRRCAEISPKTACAQSLDTGGRKILENRTMLCAPALLHAHSCTFPWETPNASLLLKKGAAQSEESLAIVQMCTNF